jgi:hypothetical protein
MELVKMMESVKHCILRNRAAGKRFISKRDGFGLNELLGIAAAIIIAAFIVIPSMRTFAQSVMNGLQNWWTNVITNRIFPST